MAYRLGVDMGTTFTAAAVANGISPTLVGLGNRALQIPSVLFLTEEGDFLVGEAAEHRALADPARVVREFKRRIGDTVPVLVGGAPYSPQTLTARLLRHVVAVAAERMGGPPDRLVLTHPANWGPYKLDLLDQVAVLAGLGRVERISEPLAAAAQYANQERVPVGETIAVYDLGGGTFDACVLRKDPDGFTVLGRPEGIEHLGGIDFDEALFHHVLDRLDTSVNDASLDDTGALNGLARLRRDCVDAKEALSTDTRTTVPIMLPGLSTTLTLERAELEELIRPALAETMLAMRRTIDSAGIEPSQLRAIVLVGGSSRIPLVRELVKAQFDVSVALDTHPKHDVALGAVRAAAAVPRTPQHSAALPSAPPPAIVTEPPGHPTEVDSGRRPRRPRRTVALAMVGVAVAGALVVTVSLTTLRPTHSSAGAGLPVVSSAEAGPSVEPPTPATSSPPPITWSLPASPPLGRDELLVAREVGTSWELYRANAASTTPGRQLTRRAGINSAPVLSPDRRTVIYIRIDTAGRRTLRVAGADDLNHDRPLFTLPAGCDRPLRPAWNPADASLLAIGCRDGAGRTTLRLMRPDGTIVATVDPPKGLPQIDDLAFSADGRRLGFWASSSKNATDGRLYGVAPSGGAPAPIFSSGGRAASHDADLAFAPDGEHIAFTRRDGKHTEIMVARADGTGAVALITGSDDNQAPTWSPDGLRIAYKSDAPTSDWPGKPVPRIWLTSSSRADPHVLWTRNAPQQQSTPAWR